MEESDATYSRVQYYWSFFIAFIWVLSLAYLPNSINILAGEKIIQPLWMFGKFRVHSVNYGDLEIWFHFTVESALRLSFLGAIFPLSLALTSILMTSRNIVLRQKLLLLCTTVITAIIFGLLGSETSVWGLSGVGPGLAGMVLIITLQVLNSWTLREQSSIIASIIVYVSLFFGFFLGDIIFACRIDQFQSLVTGGMLLSDGLVLFPSVVALLFRFGHEPLWSWLEGIRVSIRV